MALVKEHKGTSGGSKADKKRSAKNTGEAHTNPYEGKKDSTNPFATADDDDGDVYVDSGVFATFDGKHYNFDDFVDVLHDKHERMKAIVWLYQCKLKSYRVENPAITPSMAETLLGALRSAMGLGGGGRKSAKKSASDSVPAPSVAQERVTVVMCGTALVLCCGHDNKQLFDQWGEVLMSTAVGIVKGLRAQMEDFIHSVNTQEGPVKLVVASPSGITSSATAAQRKALSEISGKCYQLLVKCFDSIALLYAFDPSMSVNDDHESAPAALLQLANLVVPDYAPAAKGAFPVGGDSESFYLPVQATGALLRCLASCCEPAQGPKTRAAALRIHRFITGNTTVHVLSDDESEVSAGPDSQDTEQGDHKLSYTGLIHELIVAVAEAMGILGSRFPEMVAQDERDASGDATPTDAAPPVFTSTPLLSVEQHLVPLSSMLKRKAMGKGKGRREAQALLRQVVKKFGSLNGSNIDSIEEHEGRGGKRRGLNTTFDALSGPTSPSVKAGGNFPAPGELPEVNPNFDNSEDEAEAETNKTQFSFDGADPKETVQFRDKISVSFVGFQQINLAHCLRQVVRDGLQRHLAQNSHVMALFGIKEDLTRKIGREERHVYIQEAEESKIEEKKARQKDRDSKARARETNDE